MDTNYTNGHELPVTTDLYIQNSKSSDLIKPNESCAKLDNPVQGNLNFSDIFQLITHLNKFVL